MHAVQAVYQLAINQGIASEVVTEFQAHRLGHDLDGEPVISADHDFFQDLVLGTIDRQNALDGSIERALSLDYTLERLDMLLRALLRVAAYEMMARVDVPARVVIDEYVSLAHAFFHGGEPALVNGALDRLARDIRGDELEARPRR